MVDARGYLPRVKKPTPTARQRDLLAALHEHGALPGERSVSIHGLTRGNASGNKLTHALARGDHYGSAARGLAKQGLVESEFSSASGVELWRLTATGVEAGAWWRMQADIRAGRRAPVVTAPRGRLSGLAERLMPAA